MGKKLTSNTKLGPLERQREVANNETPDHMGVSKKSKKIKKEKNREHLTKLKDVIDGTAAIVQNEKNKKRKTPQVDKSAIKRQPGVEVKLVVPNLKPEHKEQEPKKKKSKTGYKLEANDSGTGSDTASKKLKKKRKAPLVIVTDGTVDKRKKKMGSVKDKPDVNGEEDVSKKEKWTESVDESEACEEPQKKHKKLPNPQNNHKKHPNGTKTELRASAKKPKIRVNQNKQMKFIEADENVVTSESESEEEQNGASNGINKVNHSKTLNQHLKADENESSGDDQVVKSTKDKTEKKKRFTGPEHSIFIGFQVLIQSF